MSKYLELIILNKENITYDICYFNKFGFINKYSTNLNIYKIKAFIYHRALQ